VRRLNEPHASTYKLAGVDVGHELESVVTATNAAGHRAGDQHRTTAVAADPVTVSAITPAQGPTTGANRSDDHRLGLRQRRLGRDRQRDPPKWSWSLQRKSRPRRLLTLKAKDPVVVTDGGGTSSGSVKVQLHPGADGYEGRTRKRFRAAGGTQVTITGANLKRRERREVRRGECYRRQSRGAEAKIIATSPAGLGTVNVTVTTARRPKRAKPPPTNTPTSRRPRSRRSNPRRVRTPAERR